MTGEQQDMIMKTMQLLHLWFLGALGFVRLVLQQGNGMTIVAGTRGKDTGQGDLRHSCAQIGVRDGGGEGRAASRAACSLWLRAQDLIRASHAEATRALSATDGMVEIIPANGTLEVVQILFVVVLVGSSGLEGR